MQFCFKDRGKEGKRTNVRGMVKIILASGKAKILPLRGKKGPYEGPSVRNLQFPFKSKSVWDFCPMLDYKVVLLRNSLL